MDNLTDFHSVKNKTWQQLLLELNDHEAAVLLPIVVYVVVIMVAGIIGNVIVLYIYKCRFRRSSSRAFILCLGILDLVTCLFGMPFHVLDMRYPYMFVWDIPCKVLCFLMTSTIFSSTFILVLISIERYRKICLPFEKQISDLGTKRICGGCIAAAFALSSPVLVIYGTTPFESTVSNLTAYECYISTNYDDSVFPFIYDITTITLFVISTFTLLILYTRIGITVWRKGTFQGNKGKSKNDEISTKQVAEQSKCFISSAAIEMSTIKTDQCHRLKNGNTFDEYSSAVMRSPKISFKRKTERLSEMRRSSLRLKRTESRRSSLRLSLRSSFHLRKKSISEDSSSDTFSSTLDRKSKNKLHINRKLSKKQKRSLRITGMLTLITIVFIVSFLPYLVISILNGLDKHFWTDMTSTEILIYNFLLRTYLVNNMANPFIYGFLDEKFRLEVRKLFKC